MCSWLWKRADTVSSPIATTIVTRNHEWWFVLQEASIILTCTGWIDDCEILDAAQPAVQFANRRKCQVSMTGGGVWYYLS
jgi:hypothetical protein